MQSCGLKPNHITCSILLKSVQPGAKSMNIERTMEVVDNMEDEMDDVLLSSVVEACIRVGRADLLMPWLRLSSQMGTLILAMISSMRFKVRRSRAVSSTQ